MHHLFDLTDEEGEILVGLNEASGGEIRDALKYDVVGNGGWRRFFHQVVLNTARNLIIEAAHRVVPASVGVIKVELGFLHTRGSESLWTFMDGRLPEGELEEIVTQVARGFLTPGHAAEAIAEALK